MNGKIEIKVGDDRIIVASMNEGNDCRHWNMNMIKHTLTVYWKGDYSLRTSMAFYDHSYKPNELSAKEALMAALQDAFYYGDSFPDFCSECGYDAVEDYKEAIKVFNACIRLSKQFERIGVTKRIAYKILETV